MRGIVSLKNTFGQEIAAIPMNFEEDIAPGADKEAELSMEYNQFTPEHRAIRAFDLSRGTAEFAPEHLVFADGTSARVPAAE